MYLNNNSTTPQNVHYDSILVTLHDGLAAYQYDNDFSAEKLKTIEESVISLLNVKIKESDRPAITRIIIGIVKHVRADIQRSLVERLSLRDDLDPTLLHYMAYEKINIAEPFLLNSPQLTDQDMIYIIQSKGKEHWRVIARRPKLNETVVSALVRKQDEGTIRNVLMNDTLSLGQELVQKIRHLYGSLHDETSDNLSRKVVNIVHDHVSDELMKKTDYNFLPAHVQSSEAAKKVLGQIRSDFRSTIHNRNVSMPTKDMLQTAEQFKVAGRINEPFLQEVLRRHEYGFFLALFSKLARVKHETMHHLFKSTNGEGLAIFCKTYNFSKQGFTSLYLMLNKILNPNAKIDIQKLQEALDYYQNLPKDKAESILNGKLRSR